MEKMVDGDWIFHVLNDLRLTGLVRAAMGIVVRRCLVAIISLIALLMNPPLLALERSIETRRLADNVYLLIPDPGMGSNVGVIVGETGLLLIDGMIESSFEQLDAAVRRISDLPVQLVINTHGDFDHTGANAHYAARGAQIIAQHNVAYKGPPPSIAFNDELELNFSGTTIVLTHKPSHSFEDVIVHLPLEDITFMGDIYENGWHPTFYSTGADDLRKARNFAIEQATDATVIIPGHGEPVNVDGLNMANLYLYAWLDRVRKLLRNRENPEVEEHSDRVADYREIFLGDRAHTERSIQRFQRFLKRTITSEFVSEGEMEGAPAEFTGYFFSDDGASFEVAFIDRRLVIRRYREFMIELLPLESLTFTPRASVPPEAVTFERDEGGRIIGFTWSTPTDQTVARRWDYKAEGN